MPDDLPNGYPFRQDLLNALKAMRPSFLRFPGYVNLLAVVSYYSILLVNVIPLILLRF